MTISDTTRLSAILAGEEKATTAAELMAARYRAYETGDIDFLISSQAEEGRAKLDRDEMKRWSKNAKWQGFEVLNTQGGSPTDEEGVVEFVARYELDGEDVEHHEIAFFRKEDEAWVFVDGMPARQEPYQREEAKVGPNQPCPCGSGKKHKKCCGKR